MTRFLGPVPPPDRPWAFLWPDLENGPFRVLLWFDRVNGTQSVVGVEMRSTGDELPGVPIRSEDIRLPLGELRDWWCEMQAARPRASRAAWEALPEDQRKPRAVHEAAVAAFAERVASEHRRPGRPRLTDEFLGRVTAVYNEAVDSRRPTQRVYEDEVLNPGRAKDYKTAQRWVSAARDRGFPVLPVPQKQIRTTQDRGGK